MFAFQTLSNLLPKLSRGRSPVDPITAGCEAARPEKLPVVAEAQRIQTVVGDASRASAPHQQ
jgi:hypothetical protein